MKLTSQRSRVVMATRILFGILILWMTNYNSVNGSTLEERMEMSTMELIKAEGYHGEEYEVETSDGYVLLLQRIPYGKDGPSNTSNTTVPVVFLMHGFACESSIWMENGEESLAFMLADNGFDVWTGNMRGNRNSKHKRYSKENPLFYNFSWDDHAKYDLPSQLDFVFQKTGDEKIYVGALSLGVWVILARLSVDDKYDNKIIQFHATGPVSRLTYTTIESFRLFGLLLPFINAVSPAFLLPYNNKPSDSPSCQPNCTDTQLLYNVHCHSGTSLKASLQGLQLTTSNDFSYFNYGIGNLISYGSIHTPVYKLNQVKSPVFLYSSPNDDQADPIDVARLEDDLPNVVKHLIVNDVLFLHEGFITNPEVDKMVYEPIIKSIKESEGL